MLTLPDILAYAHVMALAMWFGGLFVYVLIVWPALTGLSEDGFPRAQLVMIGIGTTPWIYLAMVGALTSFASWWILAETTLPAVVARRSWQAFRARMIASLTLGLTVLSFSLLFVLRLS